VEEERKVTVEVISMEAVEEVDIQGCSGVQIHCSLQALEVELVL
jgi:hypothetical protein